MTAIMDVDGPECCFAEFAQHSTTGWFLSIICPPDVGRRHVNHLPVGGVVQRADLVLFQGGRIAWNAAGDKYGTFERWVGLAPSISMEPADHERRGEDRSLREGQGGVERALGCDIGF